MGLETRATMDMDAAIMAEKLETVISRGDQNTRPGDYYDIYILTKIQHSNIEIMNAVRNSEIMPKQWNNYHKDFEYAMDITFKDTCDAVVELVDLLMNI